MTKHLIIGNGVAGTTAAQTIRKNNPDDSIEMVTKESVPFYSRIRLPDVVAGIAGKSDLIIKKDQWYTDNKINLHTGVIIVNIDHLKKQAKDQTGKIWEYDSLLLATGSNPFVPPIDGSTKTNVFTLRSLEHAENILKAADNAKKVVAIGGGLLGLEAAYALIKKGLDVTIVEFFDRLLPRQVDGEGALMLKSMLEAKGFKFRLGAKTKKIQGDKSVSGVELDTGEVLPCDLVLISAGVRPDLALPEILNLKTDQGLIVDEHMETSLKGVYAAGDIAQFNKINFCIWAEAQEQGKVAGANMAGLEKKFETIVPSTRLKVAEIDLASAGDIDPDNKLESEIKKTDKIYQKFVRKNRQLAGCIMLGDITGFSNAVKEIGKV